MTDSSPGFQRFFAELKRRRVFRVMAVYGVVAFAIIQVADATFPRLALPDWTITLVVWLALLGLPVAVVLAWALDLTPEGVRRTGAAAPGEIAEIIAAPASKRWPAGVLALVGVGALVIAAWYVGSRSVPVAVATSEGAASLSLAALPFTNLSADADDLYFTDGIHDELLSQLARIGALRVISRTSVMGYRGSDKSLPEIAGELGVRYVLEGSVRRFSDRVKITVQLIDAQTDAHLWAENYERPREDLFAIQSDVARQIAAALEAELSPREEASLAQAPTDDPEAYDLYLRGLDYYRRGEQTPSSTREWVWSIAIQMLERAVERDPEFALAYSRLVELHVNMRWFDLDDSPERLEKARSALDAAKTLAPDDPRTWVGQAWYYYLGHRDYEQALAAAERAAEALPSDVELIAAIGFILRRQGRFAESTGYLERSVALDPRSFGGILPTNLSDLYAGQRRWEDAERAARRAAEIRPEALLPYVLLADVEIDRGRDVAAARAQLERYPGDRSIMEWLEAAVRLDSYERRFDTALRRLEAVGHGIYEAQAVVTPVALKRATVLRYVGRDAEAAEAFGEARNQLVAYIEEHPTRDGAHESLALAHAGLGDREAAERALERVRELLPLDADRWVADGTLLNEAHAYALLGDAATAIDRLEDLLTGPYRRDFATRYDIELDPRWDPLRGHSAYAALLALAEDPPPAGVQDERQPG